MNDHGLSVDHLSPSPGLPAKQMVLLILLALIHSPLVLSMSTEVEYLWLLQELGLVSKARREKETTWRKGHNSASSPEVVFKLEFMPIIYLQ